MSAELELRSTLKRDHVKRSAHAILVVELANRGSAPQAVNARLGLSAPGHSGDVWLEIRDQSGAEVPLLARINIGRPTEHHFRVLAPGESARREIEVGEYFGLTRGTYTIRATYQSPHDRQVDGQPAWRGTLRSNEVRLEIE